MNKIIPIIASIGLAGQAHAAKGLALESQKTQADITIDGKFDDAWQQSHVVTVKLDELPYEPNNGYEGLKRTEMQVRSLYDEQYVYWMFSWEDEDQDYQRFPWQKQADGSWKHMKNLDSTKHENTWYEDKLAVFWNINEKGFAKKGCDKSCHMAEEGMIDGIADDSSGRHYTKNDYLIDEWQWKGTRTNINRQIDDGYVDSEKNTNKKWGRHPDHKTGGGYYNNFNEDKSGPAYQLQDPSQFTYWLEDKNKVPFVDNYQTGDMVPGIITSPFTGSRADVESYGYWDGKSWHLEVKRKRVTDDNTHDLQFTDLSKTYHFGVAAFDNSQINHLYHNKAIKFTFAK
ncbi:ethylbenzene dehydrogenase-related protein [Motilimonas pumila]|uniref:Ethylbenzene dehydrogenase n=1 Tax=Motilimonas pumila TaxID=2303987 RepID=A0A418YB51_9GAMM|nr:ethylbenzene dehydrogenase-related protein [Motilimonas pumila]RJG40187.1 ethylbenzene dehydrogenase [Motilimonas pumila]